LENNTSSEKDTEKKDSLWKYLVYGLVTAAVLFSLITVIRKEDAPDNTLHAFEWSAETDSLFVKNCYEQYKPQVKDDMDKQENSKKFCRCMLEKIKSKYDETSIDKVTDVDIKQWDTECRESIRW
jgi:hypothetical protein